MTLTLDEGHSKSWSMDYAQSLVLTPTLTLTLISKCITGPLLCTEVRCKPAALQTAKTVNFLVTSNRAIEENN